MQSKTGNVAGNDSSIHVVIAGDPHCGKTSIISAFLSHTPGVNILDRTTFEAEATVVIDQRPVHLFIHEILGFRYEGALCEPIYAEADIIVLCFSLADLSALDRIQTQWSPEINHFCSSKVELVLVGCKKDLRNIKHIELVDMRQASLIAWGIQAFQYIECSAFNGDGILNVFESAVKSHSKRKKKKGGCILQ